MNNFAQRHSRDAKPFFGGTYMEEAAIDKLLTPEDKEDLKKAFELGMLFAEKSPEEFSEILERRQEERKKEEKK